jgi:cardiolipin synthase A/B
VTLALILILSIGAIALGILYGRGAFRPLQHYHLVGFPDPAAANFGPTLGALTDSLPSSGQMQHIWTTAEDIQQARLRAIRSARSLIQFETFFVTPGKRADAFADAVMERAQAGVTVQLLFDHHGSTSMPDRYWQQLRDAGVMLQFFNPLCWRSPVDYLSRTHRKLLLIDQQSAWVGGAGISDLWDYQPKSDRPIGWLDIEVQFSGAMVTVLSGLFLQHWLDTGSVVNLHHYPLTPATTLRPMPLWITSGEDPTHRNSPVRSLVQANILAAQHRLWIASPYLLPDPPSCQLLGDAVQRGVDVRLLTMGDRSDKPYVYYAARERYAALLERGVQIFEYQPSMMHAKLMLLDDQWVSMGSANLDPRSFFRNDEINISTQEPALVRAIADFFQTAFEQSHLICRQHWQRRSHWQRWYGRSMLMLYWQL